MSIHIDYRYPAKFSCVVSLTFSQYLDVHVLSQVVRVDEGRVLRLVGAEADAALTAGVEQGGEDGEPLSAGGVTMERLPDLLTQAMGKVTIVNVIMDLCCLATKLHPLWTQYGECIYSLTPHPTTGITGSSLTPW